MNVAAAFTFVPNIRALLSSLMARSYRRQK